MKSTVIKSGPIVVIAPDGLFLKPDTIKRAQEDINRQLEAGAAPMSIVLPNCFKITRVIYKEERIITEMPEKPRQLRPEDFDTSLPDADGALPCWIEVGEETRQKWIKEHDFPPDTVFSGWTTVKREELSDPEPGCTYWTGKPTRRD